jgi:hypothetical protein
MYCFNENSEDAIESFIGLGKRQKSYEPDFENLQQKRTKSDSFAQAEALALKYGAKLHSSSNLSISHG